MAFGGSMGKKLNFDFLKLEFFMLFEDISDIIEGKHNGDILKKINQLFDDLIYYIYKKHRILYDEGLDNRDSLQTLVNINILPEEVMESICYLMDKANSCLTNIIDGDLTKDVLCEMEVHGIALYEILAWVVINCGEEDYSLILDSLGYEERIIFESYLPQQEIVKQPLIFEEKFNEEEIKEKASEIVEIGESYYLGRGVIKNNKEALRYFSLAAKLGDEYGESYLGLFYEKGLGIKRDYTLAYKWYYKAAVKGNSFAQYSLAMLYLNGAGVSKDYSKAMMWLQKSAESDYVPAFYQLGRVYYNGLGVEADVDIAFKWYRRGAEGGLGASQYALSFMYKNGEGCKQNTIKAYYWIEKAAENEYEDAYYIVGKSYLEGIYFDVSYEKAYYYLKKGYEALDTNCIESLGDMYINGLYVDKNVAYGLELYEKCVDYGNKDLFYKIGKVYEDEGLIRQAIVAYDQGHESGELKCTQRLGIIYYNGEGVVRDLDKAIKYMEVAASKKAPHAMYMLGIAYLRLNKFGENTLSKTKELLKEAVELKSPYAAEYLAYIMLNELREGKTIDEKLLLKYIQFGVENDLVDSMFQYGYIYEKGIAVKEDIEKAYYYYKMAADNNSIKAIVILGDWYKKGSFLSPNIDLAISYYMKAVTLRDIDATEKLIEIYEKGIGDRKSDIKALYYVFKLVELDALKGKSKLAYYCYKGIGVEEDADKGNELIEEIEEIDKGTANNLRTFLARNKFIDLSIEQIVDYYLEGIDLGNLDCYGDLADYLYENNLKDNEEYQKAFNIAMGGIELGVNKCSYIFLKDKLKLLQTSSIVTIEEILIIKQLYKLVDKGLYKVLNDLIEWYETRKPEDKSNYYKVKEQAFYYNIISK